MNIIYFALQRTLLASLCLSLGALVGAAQQPASSRFSFKTFAVPGATPLAVESINNSGTISGYYPDAAGDTVSYFRLSNGTITSYTDPLDTSSPIFTQAGQINKSGLVSGEFFDTVANTYAGYVYNSSTGTFTTYQVPNQPSATTTGLVGINDNRNLCGFVVPPPYTLASAFVEVGGVVTIFSVNGSATTACDAINNTGTTVGYYYDSNGVIRGWMRAADGTVTTIDVPGAASTPGAAPCLSSPAAGTAPLGINNAGYISGHFWDASYNEHGFLRTPAGKFLQIDVTGAFQTSGGGLNDQEVVAGHYADSSCNTFGYIATPR